MSDIAVKQIDSEYTHDPSKRGIITTLAGETHVTDYGKAMTCTYESPEK